MTEAGAACPRCELGELEVDDQEGFILCPQCGYVEEDYGLVHQGVYDAEKGPTGVLVAAGDDGRGAAGAILGFQPGGFRPSETNSRYLKSALGKLQAMASTLGITGRHVDEASNAFQQAYSSNEWQLQGVAQGTECLCAAALMLTARTAQLPLTFRDVASAAQVPKSGAAAAYKRLCALVAQPASGEALQGSSLPARPSHTLRALCIRQGALVLRRAAPHHSAAGPHQMGSAAGTSAGAGAGTVQGEASEVDLRSHPFMKAALDVCDLVSKAGICEGRSPPIVSGAVLLFLGEGQQGMHGVSGVTSQELAPLIGCTRQALSAAKELLTEQLLKLAALLPLGGFITSANIRSYLSLIITNTRVIVSLKRCRPSDALPALPAPPVAESRGASAVSTASGSSNQVDAEGEGAAAETGDQTHTEPGRGGRAAQGQGSSKAAGKGGRKRARQVTE